MTTTCIEPRTSRADPEALRDTWLFSGCSGAELEEIAALCSLVDVPAGQTLIRAGDREPPCVVVLHGQAVVKRRGRMIGHTVAGSIAGLASLIGRRATSVTIIAATDLQVLELHREALALFLARGRCWSVRHRLEVVAAEQAR